MAFCDFQNYSQVAKKCGLHVVREDFVVRDGPVPPINDFFRKDIAFIYKSFGYQRSAEAAGESLIFPIFKEVWKTYGDALTLLSHEPLEYDEQSTGIIDYVVCKRSPLAAWLPNRPFLLVGGATGWGQALSAMVAVQRHNGDLSNLIYGIATDGRYWEFGKLEGDTFVLDMQQLSSTNLDSLMAALHFVFSACREQVSKLPLPDPQPRYVNS
jgi:hypothetical protein